MDFHHNMGYLIIVTQLLGLLLFTTLCNEELKLHLIALHFFIVIMSLNGQKKLSLKGLQANHHPDLQEIILRRVVTSFFPGTTGMQVERN